MSGPGIPTHGGVGGGNPRNAPGPNSVPAQQSYGHHRFPTYTLILLHLIEMVFLL